MMEMVQARRTSDFKGERHDLFTSLLDANTEETEKGAKLLDSELIGSVFPIGSLLYIEVDGVSFIYFWFLVRRQYLHILTRWARGSQNSLNDMVYLFYYFSVIWSLLLDHSSYDMLHIWFVGALSRSTGNSLSAYKECVTGWSSTSTFYLFIYYYYNCCYCFLFFFPSRKMKNEWVFVLIGFDFFNLDVWGHEFINALHVVSLFDLSFAEAGILISNDFVVWSVLYETLRLFPAVRFHNSVHNSWHRHFIYISVSIF